MKRYRRRNAKPNQLLAYYSKLPHSNPDICFAWGGESAGRRHGAMLHYIFGRKHIDLLFGEERKKEGREWKFGKSFLEVLEENGCDLTTLKFSIEVKKPQNTQEIKDVEN